MKFEPVQSIEASRHGAALVERNQKFYNALWSTAKLIEPQRFNTWPLVAELLNQSPLRLEVAPGLRPRLPIEKTHFVDISGPALVKLTNRGGRGSVGSIMALPFADQSFDLVCALDVVEHLEDENGALSELSRVAKPGAAFLFSTPLHPEYWKPFDDFVGHCRRYEPDRLIALLRTRGFEIEQSAVYGMQVKSSRMLDWGMWWLTNFPKRSMWWYNRLIMPMGVKFEKPLTLVDGMIDTAGVDEVFMLCRKR